VSIVRAERARSGTALALGGIALDLALALLVGLIRNASGPVGERHVEGALPTVAIALAVAAPGIVALVGVVRKRAALYLAAAIACLPIAVISIAVMPIVVPAVLLVAAFLRDPRAAAEFGPLDGVIAIGFAVPVAVGVLILVTRTVPYSYTFANGHEGGDAFTRGHAVLSIALTVVDIAVVALLSGLPRGRTAVDHRQRTRARAPM